jgi:hypothetical protein
MSSFNLPKISDLLSRYNTSRTQNSTQTTSGSSSAEHTSVQNTGDANTSTGSLRSSLPADRFQPLAHPPGSYDEQPLSKHAEKKEPNVAPIPKEEAINLSDICIKTNFNKLLELIQKDSERTSQ